MFHVKHRFVLGGGLGNVSRETLVPLYRPLEVMPALLPYPRKLPPPPLILVLPCPLQDKQSAVDPPRCCTKKPLWVAPVFYTCFMGALRGAPLWGNHVPGFYRGGCP